MTDETDYGPLTQLIGDWTGNKGLDIAPEPDGDEHNPYYETISYTGIGDVTNAESQTLIGVHYVQIVQRSSDGEVFHHQTGYWLWDKEEATVMHSFVIPRAVGVLAGGNAVATSSLATKLEVTASETNKKWAIVQSPFMHENARTTEFSQQLEVSSETLSYQQTTIVEIYGKTFEHTDENELTRQSVKE